MATLVAGALSLACLFFVLSLPISKSETGKALRGWALFCFLAAIAPSVVVSFFREATGGTGAVSVGSLLATVGVLAIVAVTAYLVLTAKGLVGGKANGSSPRVARRGGYRYDEPSESDD